MFEREMAIEARRRRQPISELKRKAYKASTRYYWTTEEVDYFNAVAERWSTEIKWDDGAPSPST